MINRIVPINPFILTLLFLLISSSLPAAQTPSSACGAQSEFVRDLLSRNEWYRAVTETYRLAWSCPASSTASNLDLELGRAYLAGGMAPLARNHLYSWLAEDTRSDEDLLAGRMLLSRAYESDGDYENALYSLEKFPALPPERLIPARLRRAELKVKLLDPERSGEIEALAASLPSTWSNELGILREKDAESRKLRKKSPVLTAFLGLLPGMNLVYCGRPKQGLINMTAHTGLGGIITWAALSERWSIALALSSTAISWYAYNFTAGREACRDYNDSVEKEFRTSWSLPLDP